jgi:hypothetical protein
MSNKEYRSANGISPNPRPDPLSSRESLCCDDDDPDDDQLIRKGAPFASRYLVPLVPRI